MERSMIKLPRIPDHLNAQWPYLPHQLRARDIEVAKVVLEAAAKVLSEHQIPVGNSAAGEMACEWTYDALKDCRDVIRNLEIGHD
jgi:hypothetical protein